MALEFLFSEFFEEIDAIQEMTKGHFIDNSTDHVLPALKSALKCLAMPRDPDRSFDWEIPEKSPLRTQPSKGYERGNGGHHEVFAEISSIWRIKPVLPGKGSLQKRAAERFALAGLASTKISLKEKVSEGQALELARWRMEIASHDSPGCYFHAQILGDKSDPPPFPHSLSVPRLPIFVATPMMAIEFALGELFQDEWKKCANRPEWAFQQWNQIQQKRLLRFLSWQKDALDREKGTPFSILKRIQPDQDLFSRK